MAIKKRNETFDIKVSQADEVFLTITIGNAQIGGNVVRFKGSSKVIAKGEVENLDLGKSEDLVGKTIRITTNILDVNEQTNGIVVTYFFDSCTPAATVLHDTVESDGDIFSFIVEVTFK